MTDVVIFGGTTEGRELAQWLAGHGITVLVSVATEYGRRVLQEQEKLSVRVGRLDAGGMESLLRREQPKIVLDATHPHAQEVTCLLRQACGCSGVSCIRIVRGEEQEKNGNVIWVDTPQQAAGYLLSDDRAVLLTTGSKELEIFACIPQLAGRIYARVLPDSQVLASCEALGIRGRQLIAMQGPFSVEMNCALLRAADAGWLVTKESGSSGGFKEKIEAARICGVDAVVIRRPQPESGLTVDAAKRMLAGTFRIGPEVEAGPGTEVNLRIRPETRPGVKPGVNPKTLSLVGMGMGGGSQLTQEALQALRESDAVLGAPRILQDLEPFTAGKAAEPIYLGKDILEWMKTHPQGRNVCVVYSGDTGFYSGAGSLVRMLDEEGWDCPECQLVQVRILPGISTVSCLCARFCLSWDDLYLASAHGRDCNAVQILKEHQRVFLLLGGSSTVCGICAALAAAGLGKTRVYAGIRLGYPDEQLLKGTAEMMQGIGTDGLAAVILEREEAP